MVVRSVKSVRRKFGHCPSCRRQFVNTRSLAVEDLATHVKYSCRYRAYGYAETLTYDTIVGHRVKCRYSLRVCPAAELAICNCSWHGRYDIEGHLRENHLEECCEFVEGNFKFLCRLNLIRSVSYSPTKRCSFSYLKRKIISEGHSSQTAVSCH
jgi:hypothetical protein